MSTRNKNSVKRSVSSRKVSNNMTSDSNEQLLEAANSSDDFVIASPNKILPRATRRTGQNQLQRKTAGGGKRGGNRNTNSKTSKKINAVKKGQSNDSRQSESACQILGFNKSVNRRRNKIGKNSANIPSPPNSLLGGTPVNEADMSIDFLITALEESDSACRSSKQHADSIDTPVSLLNSVPKGSAFGRKTTTSAVDYKVVNLQLSKVISQNRRSPQNDKSSRKEDNVKNNKGKRNVLARVSTVSDVELDMSDFICKPFLSAIARRRLPRIRKSVLPSVETPNQSHEKMDCDNQNDNIQISKKQKTRVVKKIGVPTGPINKRRRKSKVCFHSMLELEKSIVKNLKAGNCNQVRAKKSYSSESCESVRSVRLEPKASSLTRVPNSSKKARTVGRVSGDSATLVKPNQAKRSDVPISLKRSDRKRKLSIGGSPLKKRPRYKKDFSSEVENESTSSSKSETRINLGSSSSEQSLKASKVAVKSTRTYKTMNSEAVANQVVQHTSRVTSKRSASSAVKFNTRIMSSTTRKSKGDVVRSQSSICLSVKKRYTAKYGCMSPCVMCTPIGVSGRLAKSKIRSASKKVIEAGKISKINAARNRKLVETREKDEIAEVQNTDSADNVKKVGKNNRASKKVQPEDGSILCDGKLNLEEKERTDFDISVLPELKKLEKLPAVKQQVQKEIKKRSKVFKPSEEGDAKKVGVKRSRNKRISVESEKSTASTVSENAVVPVVSSSQSSVPKADAKKVAGGSLTHVNSYAAKPSNIGGKVSRKRKLESSGNRPTSSLLEVKSTDSLPSKKPATKKERNKKSKLTEEVPSKVTSKKVAGKNAAKPEPQSKKDIESCDKEVKKNDSAGIMQTAESSANNNSSILFDDGEIILKAPKMIRLSAPFKIASGPKKNPANLKFTSNPVETAAKESNPVNTVAEFAVSSSKPVLKSKSALSTASSTSIGGPHSRKSVSCHGLMTPSGAGDKSPHNLSVVGGAKSSELNLSIEAIPGRLAKFRSLFEDGIRTSTPRRVPDGLAVKTAFNYSVEIVAKNSKQVKENSDLKNTAQTQQSKRTIPAEMLQIRFDDDDNVGDVKSKQVVQQKSTAIKKQPVKSAPVVKKKNSAASKENKTVKISAPPTSKVKEAAKKPAKAKTKAGGGLGGKGTLKRRKNIREMVEEYDKQFSSCNDIFACAPVGGAEGNNKPIGELSGSQFDLTSLSAMSSPSELSHTGNNSDSFNPFSLLRDSMIDSSLETPYSFTTPNSSVASLKRTNMRHLDQFINDILKEKKSLKRKLPVDSNQSNSAIPLPATKSKIQLKSKMEEVLRAGDVPDDFDPEESVDNYFDETNE